MGEIVVLALPVAAALLALRAHRAGYPKARSTVAAAIVVGLAVMVLPIGGVPGGSPASSDESWKHWAADVDLSGLPAGAYEQGQTYPETRSNGLVVAVHTQWTTDRPPRQACADFTDALNAAYPDVTVLSADDLGCLISANGQRIMVEIHEGSFGSGAVADVTQPATGG